mgnify:FL=1
MKPRNARRKAKTTATFGDEDISLAHEDCVANVTGKQKLTTDEAQALLAQINPHWSIEDQPCIQRAYDFPDFSTALAFVVQAGAVCEEQNHHADFHLSWGSAVVKIWTHDAGGLTRSDFILAAKIDLI